MVLLTWSRIGAHSYFLEALGVFTSPQSFSDDRCCIQSMTLKTRSYLFYYYSVFYFYLLTQIRSQSILFIAPCTTSTNHLFSEPLSTWNDRVLVNNDSKENLIVEVTKLSQVIEMEMLHWCLLGLPMLGENCATFKYHKQKPLQNLRMIYWLLILWLAQLSTGIM